MAEEMVAVSNQGTRRGMAAGLLARFEEQEPSVAVGTRPTEAVPMNNIIYIIGLIVVVLAILAFFGLR